MKNYKGKGDFITVTATGTVISGLFYVISGFAGIAMNDAATGQDVVLCMDGLAEVPKASVAVSIGQNLYWSGTDASPYNVGVKIGEAVVSALESESTVLVRLRASASINAPIQVRSKYDLPAPVDGDYILQSGMAYFICGDVDLEGGRLVTSGKTTIFGGSSETSSLTSTGLASGKALIKSNYTLAMQFLTLKDVHTAFDIDGTGNNVALDWTGVNVENVPNIGTIQNFGNFVYTKGAFLNAQGLVFDGEFDTSAFNFSLLQGTGAAGDIISVPATATINRRFRKVYGPVIAFGSTVGLNVSASASIPTEGYILDNVSFSGGGTYLAGVQYDSNTALFRECTGIENSYAQIQAGMQSNAVATVVSNTSDFYQIAGTFVLTGDASKFDINSNQLRCRSKVSRRYKILIVLSFTSGNGNVCEFGIYDSRTGLIREGSKVKATANASGRAENIALIDTLQMEDLDYIYPAVRNTTAANDVTVEQINVLITI